MYDSSTLSIKNSSGKTFSLLNDNNAPIKNTKLVPSLTATTTTTTTQKRKYHCNEPGCNKSFTTSGHLARHHRIHTGEKNFHCLYPGCPSRFSRQDNMMQHYRTHLSQKVRRQQNNRHQQKKIKEEPHLYRHSHHGPEDHMSFQPLVTNRRRSVTMPSLPYPSPNMLLPVNRPKRALSTSSTCSTLSSSFAYSPPQSYELAQPQKQLTILPPPQTSFIRQQNNYQNPHHEWAPRPSQKPLSNLLHLANIVSTFG